MFVMYQPPLAGSNGLKYAASSELCSIGFIVISYEKLEPVLHRFELSTSSSRKEKSRFKWNRTAVELLLRSFHVIFWLHLEETIVIFVHNLILH